MLLLSLCTSNRIKTMFNDCTVVRKVNPIVQNVNTIVGCSERGYDRTDIQNVTFIFNVMYLIFDLPLIFSKRKTYRNV